MPNRFSFFQSVFIGFWVAASTSGSVTPAGWSASDVVP
jgi:hypothetical protein